MSPHLDASMLDRVWDAHLLGAPPSSQVKDAGDRALLALLDELEQPQPNPVFVQQLARALDLAARATSGYSTVTPPSRRDHVRVTALPRTDPWRATRSRWMGVVSTLAAIVLLFVVSAFAIIYQRTHEPDLSSIPAVGGGSGVGLDLSSIPVTGGGNGGSTSVASGFESFSLGANTLTLDDLEEFHSRDWHWVGITRGTIAPGESTVIAEGSPAASGFGYAGFGVIAVEAGALSASVAPGALIQRGQLGTSEFIADPTVLTLEPGDALFVAPEALLGIENSGQVDVSYVAGGVYSLGPNYPLDDDDDDANRLQGGIQVDPNDLAIGEPVALTLSRATVGPGQTFHYSISSETWLLAMVTGEGLQQQKRIDGEASSAAVALDAGVHSLHESGFGDYELSNVGAEPVDVYFFRAEALPQRALASQVDSLVGFTLSAEQLLGYRFDDWRWLQFNRNTVVPQGDSQEFRRLTSREGWNPVPGMNLMAVESGVINVTPEADVLVVRGPLGVPELVPGGSDITLLAGDAVLYLSGTEGRYWNPSDIDTILVGGGGYIRPDYPNFGAVRDFIAKSGEFAHGTTVAAREMPDGAPISFAIERVSIAPDAGVTIDLDPGIWTLVSVERGDLLQTTYQQGIQMDESVALRQGEVTLRFEEGKTVELRNVGESAAVVYLMRVEPVESDNVS